jgi:hypothetical protein
MILRLVVEDGIASTRASNAVQTRIAGTIRETDSILLRMLASRADES